MINLDALIRAAHDLEPLPASVTRLASVVAREDSNLDEIVEIIEFDQALTAALLKSANSAAFAPRVQVTTVRVAVSRLGSGTVLSLGMGAAVHSRMNAGIPEYGLSEGELWRHSVTSALAAETCPKLFGLRLPPESFTAALLHDVGKLLLARYLDPTVRKVLHEACETGGVDRLQAEREILGVHHAELGGLIAQVWELPESIVQAIIFHHAPSDVQDSPFEDSRTVQAACDAVHVANSVAHAIDAETFGLPMCEHPEATALARLGLTAARFEQLCEATAEKLDRVLVRYD